jgi:hypothetical protein
MNEKQIARLTLATDPRFLRAAAPWRADIAMMFLLL